MLKIGDKLVFYRNWKFREGYTGPTWPLKKGVQWIPTEVGIVTRLTKKKAMCQWTTRKDGVHEKPVSLHRRAAHPDEVRDAEQFIAAFWANRRAVRELRDESVLDPRGLLVRKLSLTGPAEWDCLSEDQMRQISRWLRATCPAPTTTETRTPEPTHA